MSALVNHLRHIVNHLRHKSRAIRLMRIMRAAGVTLMSDMITLRLTCLPCGPSCYSQARRQLHDFEYMRAPLLLPGPHELRHIYIYMCVCTHLHFEPHYRPPHVRRVERGVTSDGYAPARTSGGARQLPPAAGAAAGRRRTTMATHRDHNLYPGIL